MPFIFTILGNVLVSVGVKLLTSLFSERMVKQVFFSLAKYVASKTETKKDDEFLGKWEESYDEEDTKGSE